VKSEEYLKKVVAKSNVEAKTLLMKKEYSR